ncbi:integrating conjugative element protein [Pseudomonas sp. lyk4-TYG-107]|uniref:integrating conjugative element protein n=1 Tax=Pseudomonas sp. lyk4-TYG-107 TaxID=3040317 RepID=UPI002557C16F|nr:integrating conjugative element protein [Pseudomonas sp. lyk4-TYG-107]
MKIRYPWILLICAVFCCGSSAQTVEPRHADARYSEEDFLPVHSSALSPGLVKSRTLDAAGLPSFFLIGDDPHSRSWLKKRHLRLTTLNAVGLVVNIESKAALESLRHIAPGLTLSPVSADDLAQRLNLQHYPVLITASKIEQ